VYNATISDYDELKTQGGENAKLPAGTDYVRFTFELTDEEVSGKTLRTSVYFTEKSKPKLKEFLVGMGLDDDGISKVVIEGFEASDFVGTNCKIQVGLGQVQENGQRYNNILRVLPADDTTADLPS
jgi:hypothetical protein